MHTFNRACTHLMIIAVASAVKFFSFFLSLVCFLGQHMLACCSEGVSITFFLHEVFSFFVFQNLDMKCVGEHCFLLWLSMPEISRAVQFNISATEKNVFCYHRLAFQRLCCAENTQSQTRHTFTRIHFRKRFS